MLASTAQSEHNRAGAWADASAAAEFAALIAVNCEAEGHADEPCEIRRIAQLHATAALEAAREQAESALAA